MDATGVSEAASSLRRLEAGFVPAELFYELARLTSLTAVEIVPVSADRTNRIWVLLVRRAADDPFWPSKLHSPGTIVRPTDVGPGFADAFSRIFEGELKGGFFNEPVFNENLLLKTERGTSTCIVHYAEIIQPPETGELFLVNELPNDLIVEQRAFIQGAARAYEVSLSETAT